MSDAFAHLHVASGFSLRYGASTPAALVERAASLGQPALALTDRDGLYGAVRFVQACGEADIAPVLGVDLAVGPERSNTVTGQGVQAAPAETGRTGTGRARTGCASPARGGAEVDPRYPRVTVLARGYRGSTSAPPRAGLARPVRARPVPMRPVSAGTA